MRALTFIDEEVLAAGGAAGERQGCGVARRR